MKGPDDLKKYGNDIAALTETFVKVARADTEKKQNNNTSYELSRRSN